MTLWPAKLKHPKHDPSTSPFVVSTELTHKSHVVSTWIISSKNENVSTHYPNRNVVHAMHVSKTLALLPSIFPFFFCLFIGHSPGRGGLMVSSTNSFRFMVCNPLCQCELEIKFVRVGIYTSSNIFCKYQKSR